MRVYMMVKFIGADDLIWTASPWPGRDAINPSSACMSCVVTYMRCMFMQCRLANPQRDHKQGVYALKLN